MTPRPGMAETRRRALIGAALREISDRGSLDVTVAQIASRAGVSSALAHHYFGAKDDLILATMRHLLAEFGGRRVAARLTQADGPRARLSAIIARQLRRRAVPPRDDQRLADLLRLGAVLARRRAAAPRLPAAAAIEPRARAEAAGAGAPRPGGSPRASAPSSTGCTCARPCAAVRPTPEAAIAAIEDYLDRELGRIR